MSLQKDNLPQCEYGMANLCPQYLKVVWEKE